MESRPLPRIPLRSMNAVASEKPDADEEVQVTEAEPNLVECTLEGPD
jgi:hypothetical protein